MIDKLHYCQQDFPGLLSLGFHVDTSKCVNQDYRPHTHDFYETFIIISGTATHLFGNQEYPLEKGDVFSIKGNMPHGFSNVDHMRICNLMYMPQIFYHNVQDLENIPGFAPFFVIEPILRDHPVRLRIDDTAVDRLTTATQFIQDLIDRDDASLYPCITLGFKSVIAYLASLYKVNPSVSSQMNVVAKALLYMELNLQSKIKVDDIASYVHLSRRHFERIFFNTCQETPIEHLNGLRMKWSLNLLIEQNKSVSEVSRLVGIDDPSYFSRLFRQYFGITPSSAKRFMVRQADQ